MSERRAQSENVPDSPARARVAKHHIKKTFTMVNKTRNGSIVTPTITIFRYWYHGRCIVRLMKGFTWWIETPDDRYRDGVSG